MAYTQTKLKNKVGAEDTNYFLAVHMLWEPHSVSMEKGPWDKIKDYSP